MKRIVLVLLIWTLLVGGHSLYTHLRQIQPADTAKAVSLHPAEGHYTIEITPTFSAVPDPFALMEENTQEAALVLSMSGRELIRRADTIRAGVPIRIDNVSGMVDGSNEFFVSASPPAGASEQRHFVQIRILRDNFPVAQHIFWSEGGARVAGSFRFHPSLQQENAHEH